MQQIALLVLMIPGKKELLKHHCHTEHDESMTHPTKSIPLADLAIPPEGVGLSIYHISRHAIPLGIS
jgi:hypothetical protein